MKKSMLLLLCLALCLFAFSGGALAADQLDPIPAFAGAPAKAPLLGAGEEDNIIEVPTTGNRYGYILSLEVTEGASVDQDLTETRVESGVGYIDIVVKDGIADDATIKLTIKDFYSAYGSLVFNQIQTVDRPVGSISLANMEATVTLEGGRYIGRVNVRAGGMNTSSYVITIRQASDNNNFPELAGDAAKKEQATVGTAKSIDIASFFNDPDEDDLTYSVKINGGDAQTVTSPYSYTPSATGVDTLVFTANDGQLTSLPYTLTLICLDEGAEIYDVSGSKCLSTRTNYRNNLTRMALFGADVKRVLAWGDTGFSFITILLDPDTADDAEVTLVAAEGSHPEDGEMKFRQLTINSLAKGTIVSPAMNGNLLTTQSAAIKVKLENGEFYRQQVYFSSGNTATHQITVRKATQGELDANGAPTLKNGITDDQTIEAKVGTTYTYDLTTIFQDPNHDQMTYKVKVDDEAEVELPPVDYYAYKYVLATAGNHTLVFTANDGRGGEVTYTVNHIGYNPTQIPVTVSPDVRQPASWNDHNGRIANLAVYGNSQTKAEVFSEYIEPTGTSQPPNRGVLELVFAPDTDPNATFYADLTISSGRGNSTGGIKQINTNADDKGTMTYSGNVITCAMADGEFSKEMTLHWGQYSPQYDKYYLVKAHIATEREWANNRPARKPNINATNRLNRVVDTLDATLNNNRYNVNLDNIFVDLDDDTMSYTVTIDGVTSDVEGSVFHSEPYGPDDAGTFTYVFQAKDEFLTSIDTYTVHVDVTVNEHRPDLADGVLYRDEDYRDFANTVTAEPYRIDLTKIFADPDENDTLKYTVAIAKYGEEAGEPEEVSANYAFEFPEAGTYVLTFNAIDTANYESRHKYILTLTGATVGENAVAVDIEQWPELKYIAFYKPGSEYVQSGSYESLAKTPVSGNTINSITYDEQSKHLTFDIAFSDAFSKEGTVGVYFCYQPNPDSTPFLAHQNNGFHVKRRSISPGLSGNVVSGNSSYPLYTTRAGSQEDTLFRVSIAGRVEHENNNAPVYQDGVEAEIDVNTIPDAAYTLNLANIFKDNDGDRMTYSVSVDGKEEASTGNNYSVTYPKAGNHVLKFYATDYSGAKSEAYTVNLTVDEVSVIPTNGNNIQGDDKWVKEIVIPGISAGDYEWTANDDAAAKAAGYTQENNSAVKGGKLYTANYDYEVTINLPSTVAPDAEFPIAFNYSRSGDRTYAGHNSAHRFNSDEFTYLGGAGNENFGEGIVNYTSPNKVKLEDGQGTFYYRIHSVADLNWTYPRNYKIHFVVGGENNHAPALKEGAAERITVLQGNNFELNLNELFSDPDNDTLSYTVEIGEAKPVVTEAEFVDDTLTELGEYTYIFTAKDKWGDKAVYNVTVEVVDPAGYHTSVSLPADIVPGFYGVDGEGNVDSEGLAYTSETGENGFEVYDVTVPHQFSAIAVGDIDEEIGQVIVATKDGEGAIIADAGAVRPLDVVVTNVVDGKKLTAEQIEVTVTDKNSKALTGGLNETNSDNEPVYHFLAVVGEDEYTVGVKAKGDLATRYEEASVKQTVAGDKADVIEVKVALEPTQAEKDRLAAQAVVDQIAALKAPAQITTADKEAIEAARAAYSGLSDAQKALVTNEATLKAAEDALAAAEQAAADAAAAKVVADQIAALGNDPTAAAVKAARDAYNDLSDAQKALVPNEDALKAAEKAIADKAIAKAVEDQIAALGNDPEAAAVKAARAAFDALSDDQKALVPNEDALKAAEKTVADKAAAKEVADQIGALPAAAEVTTADAEAIGAALAAYEALSDDQKALVPAATKTALDAAKAALDEAIAKEEKAKQDQAKADEVKGEIAALPAIDEITADDKAAVDKVKADYDALTDAQKALVPEETKKALDDAVEAVAKAVADKAAADAVEDAIEALPAADKLTAADKEAVDKAKAAYDALTDAQKALVPEATKKALDEAVAAVKKAVDDKTAADAVKAAIDALPATDKLTANDKAAVEKARADYDKLSDAQKALVGDEAKKKLADAEAKIKELEPKPQPKPRFVDVPDNAYFKEAVDWAVSHEPVITTGTDATHFTPNGDCTRGQVVTFLWRAAGTPEPTSTTNPFVDVPANQYYYKAVLWAVEKGITTGTDKTHFTPNGKCTRGQVVTFLWRANGSPEVNANVSFSDVKTGAYYEKAVKWAVAKAITQGTGAGKFSPDATCTRAQVVTFLWRAQK